MFSFVLAATEHLEGTLQKLEARMHSLEDALAITYAASSKETHPLLVKCKNEDAEEDSPRLPPPDLQESEEVSTPSAKHTLTDSLGVLHIDEDGGSRFFGPSAGSEVSNLRLLCAPTSFSLVHV